jgi:hypothetical protein
MENISSAVVHRETKIGFHATHAKTHEECTNVAFFEAEEHPLVGFIVRYNFITVTPWKRCMGFHCNRVNCPGLNQNLAPLEGSTHQKLEC